MIFKALGGTLGSWFVDVHAS